MTRKEFIRRSSLFLSILPGFSLLASHRKTGKEPEAMGTVQYEFDEMGIAEFQEQMKTGKLNAEELCMHYLKKIDQLDKNGPKLNAVIEINPDVLFIARSLDDERKSGKIRGPLHGIPVLIKDNIDTSDKMMTTAGSLALMKNIAREDAFIVKKLREAGAVILGKTNLSEWANFRSTKSSSGWSSRGGQTKNPYFLDHNPCGSSSGSAVAVSANLCAVAIGTETDGSITCPSAVCGVVGFKPTVGLLSRTGIIPISKTQDTAGPICRTVKDTALFLSELAGRDVQDEASLNNPQKDKINYSLFLQKDGLKNKKIGVDKKHYENPLLSSLQQKAIDVLKSQGAEIIEIDYLDQINALADAEFKVLCYEFKDGINKYLAKTDLKLKNLQDIIQFNLDHQDKVMPSFRQEILQQCQKCGDLLSDEYQGALKMSRDETRKILDEILKKHSLDAFAGLTMGPACSIDTIYGDKWGDVFLTAPAAMSGYPHISVPCGKAYDLPVGFSFFSGPWKEGELIAMAYAYEQASMQREPPQFRSSFLE